LVSGVSVRDAAVSRCRTGGTTGFLIDGTQATGAAYRRFASWVGSRGATDGDWFKSPNTSSKARVTDPLAGASRTRAWTVRAGGL
jgi:hypothetical protein